MSRTSRSLVLWVLLSPIVLLALLPYAVMVSTTLKPAMEVLAYLPRWLPQHLDLANFTLM
jgi:multiple sugar transport system permease protein